MNDIADQAEDRYENWLEGNIQKVRERPSLKPCGHCYNCNEPVSGQMIFCDVDCRDDYDKRK